MSWEGYDEGLCLNGHIDRWENSAYAHIDPPLSCWYCSAPYAQVWTVDETNGCQEAEDGLCICGKRDLEKVEESSTPTCPTCEEPKFVPAVYKFVPEVYAGHEVGR